MNFRELRQQIATIREQAPEHQVLAAILALFRDRYAEFDEQAQREADRILDGMIEIGAPHARRHIETLPDGAERRALARGIAQTEDAHFNAHDMIGVLKGESQQTNPVVAESVHPFAAALQACLDLLYEARNASAAGKRGTVLHGLFTGLVDELLVAFHLAQRAFASQAYAHLRTVEEVLDAIDVFVADAALLDRWLAATVPGDERAVFKEIRQRVGSSVATADGKKLYAFLSALGPHAQFRAFRSRTELSQNEAGERIATIYLLGSREQLEAANVLTVRAAAALAGHIAQAFTSVLNADDVSALLAHCRTSLSPLVRTYLVPIAGQMNLTTEEVGQVLAHRIEESAKG